MSEHDMKVDDKIEKIETVKTNMEASQTYRQFVI